MNQHHHKPFIRFDNPDGHRSAVFVDGEPAGDIERSGHFTWNYQPLGMSGSYLELRRRIRQALETGQ